MSYVIFYIVEKIIFPALFTLCQYFHSKFKIHSIFGKKHNIYFQFIFHHQVSFVDRPFYPFHICYFYFTYHFYRPEIIQLSTDMVVIFLNVLFSQHLQLYCHKLACISYCLPEIWNHSLPLALGDNFLKILDSLSCTNQSKFHTFSNWTEKKTNFWISWNRLIIDRFQLFCWCFLLDVVLCGMSIIAYVIFNKKSIKRQRSDDLEESITQNEPSSSISMRQKQLNLDTQAVLKRIGTRIDFTFSMKFN